MRVSIRRAILTRSATFGWLVAGPLELFTLELPWRDNEPGVSCVPTGLYALVRHESARFGRTWALVGGTVSHHPRPDARRSAILFHAANLPGELRGCIAPGKGIVTFREGMGVTGSRYAMRDLLGLLSNEPEHELVIE